MGMNSRVRNLCVHACRITHAISILSASQLHLLANKNLNWLVTASKLHKRRRTGCTAEWPYCLFAILLFLYTQSTTYGKVLAMLLIHTNHNMLLQIATHKKFLT